MLYFDRPTMVVFENPDFDENCLYGGDVPRLAGIAYKDEIICGCCGGLFEIEELEKNGFKIRTLEWINITEEIGGDLTL